MKLCVYVFVHVCIYIVLVHVQVWLVKLYEYLCFIPSMRISLTLEEEDEDEEDAEDREE